MFKELKFYYPFSLLKKISKNLDIIYFLTTFARR